MSIKIIRVPIREGIFETASSSVHSVVFVAKDAANLPIDLAVFDTNDNRIITSGGTFGWGPAIITDPRTKIDWLATYFIERAWYANQWNRERIQLITQHQNCLLLQKIDSFCEKIMQLAGSNNGDGGLLPCEAGPLAHGEEDCRHYAGILSEDMLNCDDIARLHKFHEAVRKLTNMELDIYIDIDDGCLSCSIDHESDRVPTYVLDRGVEFIVEFIRNRGWVLIIDNDNEYNITLPSKPLEPVKKDESCI